MLEWPDTYLSSTSNAARLARFAVAAYPGNEDSRKSLKADIQKDSHYYEEWSKGNADGILCVDDNNVVIALAGTDSKRDVVTDIDVWPERVGAIAKDFGLQLNCDSHVEVHLGFATYAVLCYRVLSERIKAADDKGLRLWTKNVWITGHSLGGAAAYCLSLFDPFGSATIYQFGAPAVLWHRNKYRPVRKCVSTRHILDPVPGMPPIGFRHPQSKVLYLRYPGSVRSKTTAFAKIAFGVYQARAAVRYFASKIGLRESKSMLSGPVKYHAMQAVYESYLQDLK